MTIQLLLIPDGMAQIPPEATDSSVLATYLEKSGYADWSSVRRLVYGGGGKIELELDGQLSDYNQSDLSTISDSITSNINGLKEHPEGWREVTEPQSQQSQ